jgi:hypothetical protein
MSSDIVSDHGHDVLMLCSRTIGDFRAKTGDRLSVLPRSVFKIAMHPNDAVALEAVVGPRVPGYPLMFAGLTVFEDARFETPVVAQVEP